MDWLWNEKVEGKIMNVKDARMKEISGENTMKDVEYKEFCSSIDI